MSDKTISLDGFEHIHFLREPIMQIGTIPVFSQQDNYTRNYEEIASKHVESLKESGTNPFMQSEVVETLNSSTVAIISGLTDENSIILDAGVGPGLLLREIEAQGRYGIDITTDYLELAQSQGINVALSKIEDMPFADEQFDLVVTTDVLEHVLDFYSVCCQLERVLKIGGHLVIRVPFEEEMQAYYDYTEFDYVHVRRMDEYSLRIMFERILGMEYVNHSTVLPYYRGLPTSKYSFPDDLSEISNILSEVGGKIEGYDDVRAAMDISSKRFSEFMNKLAQVDSQLYERLGKAVAKDLEINIVFKKVANSDLAAVQTASSESVVNSDLTLNLDKKMQRDLRRMQLDIAYMTKLQAADMQNRKKQNVASKVDNLSRVFTSFEPRVFSSITAMQNSIGAIAQNTSGIVQAVHKMENVLNLIQPFMNELPEQLNSLLDKTAQDIEHKTELLLEKSQDRNLGALTDQLNRQLEIIQDSTQNQNRKLQRELIDEARSIATQLSDRIEQSENQAAYAMSSVQTTMSKEISNDTVIAIRGLIENLRNEIAFIDKHVSKVALDLEKSKRGWFR